MSVWAKDKNWLILYRKEQTKQHVLSIQNKDMQINPFLSLHVQAKESSKVILSKATQETIGTIN